MRTLSRTIPINSSVCEGPIVLEATVGAWTDMKNFRSVLKLSRHARLGKEEIVENVNHALEAIVMFEDPLTRASES